MEHPKKFDVHFYNNPLEIELDPNLSEQEKYIFWIVSSICKKRKFCYYTNKEFQALLKVKFTKIHPMTISQAVSKLIKKSAIISTIEIVRAGTRRKLSINPDFKKSRERLVAEFNGVISVRREAVGYINPLTPISQSTYPPQVKDNENKGLAANIYNKDSYHFLSGNDGEQGSPQSTTEKEDQGMSVHLSRSVDRIVDHWKSKTPSLQKPKDKTIKKASPVIKSILNKYSETKVKEAIDLYHRCLNNPMLVCGIKNKSLPNKVSLPEFFKFGLDTNIFIQNNHIKGFEGVDSWFALCLKGEEEIEKRFVLVPTDKYPIVTNLLKKVVTSWDRHPPIVGNEAERQLRKSSVKLVEFHHRIQKRIIAWRRIVRASVPEFLKEYLIPYILNNLNLEQFRIYWLMSDKFLYNFERHLEEIQVVARPTMVRHKLKKRVDACDQDISFRGRGRAINHHGYDCERDLSAADF